MPERSRGGVCEGYHPQAMSMPPHDALPPDDAERESLHNEVHARPPASIELPALVVYVAVLNDGVAREAECEHLRRLAGHAALTPADLQRNFLRLRLGHDALKWERHSEFTRYSIVLPLPPGAARAAPAIPAMQTTADDAFDVDTAADADAEALERDQALQQLLAAHASWLRAIPGRTVAAVQLIMLQGDIADAPAVLARSRAWLGAGAVVASRLGASRDGGPAGDGHAVALTDFRLRHDGFERILVIAPAGTSQSRAGRIAQRLLEIETYRLMALRGLPVAKALGPLLADAEVGLADITAHLEGTSASDQELLDQLIGLAAGVERASAEHLYRFSATQAYDGLVGQRIAELREKAIPGSQSIGEFMQRRLSPAMATVAATAQRLASLSQRIERASALLRTRVNIATEAQNQQLLAKLTRGQELQLRLQSTVEGLSIAAITYYMVSLLLYGAKAARAAGLPLDPELAAGVAMPLVLWAVWSAIRRIHARLHRDT